MDRDFLIVVVVASLGIVVGAIRVAWWWRERSRERALALEGPPLSGHALALLQALPGVVIVVDSDDNVARSDVAALAMGLVRDGRLQSQALREGLRTFLDTGEKPDLEIEAPCQEGDASPVILRVDFVRLADDYTVVIARDYTPQQRLDETRRRFIADASHELKTPVGAVALLAETIRDSADDPEAVRHFTASLMRESQRLSRLISDIIELSRVQGKAPLQRAEVCRLGPILAAALARETTTAAGRGIRIEAGDSGDADDKVLGVADQLEGAFANLLDNAVRYSPDGELVRVSISREPGRVNVAIADNGIGIPACEHEAIFRRFYRVDPARSRASGGTGLGLSIVKHVIADHRGHIRVESEPGQGATFTVSLPTVDTEETSTPKDTL